MPYQRLGDIGKPLGEAEYKTIGPVNLQDTMFLEPGAAILSQNFVSGSTGFRLQFDGAAEFNDVTVRGIIDASTIQGATTITSALFRTAASGARLEIDGQSADSYVTLYNASAAVGYMGLGVPTLGSTELAIRTSSSLNSIRLKSDGAIYLEAGGLSGTGVIIADTPAGASPSYPFRVWDGSDNKILDFSTRPQLQAASGDATYPIYSFTSGQGYGMYFRTSNSLGFSVNSALRLYMSTSGLHPNGDNTYDIGTSTTGRFRSIYMVGGSAAAATDININTTTGQLFQVTSSKRFKKNITDWGGGLELLEPLRLRKFQWKDDDEWSLGMVAEELMETRPEFVNLDADGEPWSIKYSSFVVPLIDAVRELQAEVARLRAIVEA